MANGFSTGGNVAGTLQEILARKRAESRQAMLDDLTRKDTESQIGLRGAQGGYYGKLGENMEFNQNKDLAGLVNRGTDVSTLSPNVASIFEQTGRIGGGQTPSVTTTDDVSGETNVSSGVPSPRVTLGTSEQIQGDQSRATVQNMLTDPSTPDALKRSLQMVLLGVSPNVDEKAVNPGQQMVFDELGGKVATSDRSYGGDVVFNRSFDPARTAGLSARISAGVPDWKPQTFNDPVTGLPRTYFFNSKAGDISGPGAVIESNFTPVTDGKPVGTQQQLADFFSASGDPVQRNAQAMNMAAGMGASPKVTDLLQRLMEGTYQPAPATVPMAPGLQILPTDPPQDVANKVAINEGLNEMEKRQLIMLAMLTLNPQEQ